MLTIAHIPILHCFSAMHIQGTVMLAVILLQYPVMDKETKVIYTCSVMACAVLKSCVQFLVVYTIRQKTFKKSIVM